MKKLCATLQNAESVACIGCHSPEHHLPKEALASLQISPPKRLNYLQELFFGQLVRVVWRGVVHECLVLTAVGAQALLLHLLF